MSPLGGSPVIPPLALGENGRTRSMERMSSTCNFSLGIPGLTPRGSSSSLSSPELLAADAVGRKFHDSLLEDACRGFPVTIELLKHFHTLEQAHCEEFFQVMTKYFANRDNRHISLFRAVMELELAEISPSVLFRGESVGVRLWATIADLDGLPFYRKLTAHIHKVIEKVTLSLPVITRIGH